MAREKKLFQNFVLCWKSLQTAGLHVVTNYGKSEGRSLRPTDGDEAMEAAAKLVVDDCSGEKEEVAGDEDAATIVELL